MFKVTISSGGNAPDLAAKVSGLDARLRKAMVKGLDQGLADVQAVAFRDYLTGPRPQRLGVVTQRLRGSLTHEVQETADGVSGVIGTNVPYAAYHEFGFHGVENVKGFNRVTHRQLAKAKFWRVVKKRLANKKPAL